MEREKEIEARLKREVEKMGGWCLKFISPGRSGVPDRLLLFPGGKMVFVELKRWGEKPRPLQERVMGRLRNLGFEVWVLDDKKEIGKLLQQVAGEEGKGAEKT